MLVLSLASLSAFGAPKPPPTTRPLRWLAERGDHGKPPPQGTAQWEAFLGKSAGLRSNRFEKPAHHDPVLLSGLNHSTDAAPAHPLTLGQVSTRFVRSGVPKRVADRAAMHALFGMPSDAAVTSWEDHLVVRKDMVTSYSSSRRGPNWVMDHFNKTDIGTVGRSDSQWRADPSLSADFVPAKFSDYHGAGIDPGHMRASHVSTNTPRANARTYVMSQTLPQAFNNNRGPWLAMEHYTQDLALHEDAEIYEMSGGLFGTKPIKIGSGVSVPNGTWKVAVVLRPGQTLADVGPTTRVISIIVPNSDSEVRSDEPLGRFLTTPAEIERLTGLHFFSSLPKPIADALRTQRDTAAATATAPHF